jgi:hypothetical protein
MSLLIFGLDVMSIGESMTNSGNRQNSNWKKAKEKNN